MDRAHDGAPEISLAIGVFLGGLVQFLFPVSFSAPAQHAGLAQVGLAPSRGGEDPYPDDPALFGVSVSQINLLINTMLASFLATGAISYLYYSDRLLEFPSVSLRWPSAR